MHFATEPYATISCSWWLPSAARGVFSYLFSQYSHWCSQSDVPWCWTLPSGWLWFATREKLIKKCLWAFWHMHTHSLFWCLSVTVSGSVSQPRVSFKDVTWSFRYQGLKNTILRPCILSLIVNVCKYSLITHLHVQNISFLSARQQFFCPLFQSLCQRQTLSPRLLSRGMVQNNTTHH